MMALWWWWCEDDGDDNDGSDDNGVMMLMVMVMMITMIMIIHSGIPHGTFKFPNHFPRAFKLLPQLYVAPVTVISAQFI